MLNVNNSMFSLKNIRISRSSSLSIAGRIIDRNNTKPLIPQPLKKSKSITSMNSKEQIHIISDKSKQKRTLKSKSKEKNEEERKKDAELKIRIKKQVDLIKQNAKKGRRLILNSRGQGKKEYENTMQRLDFQKKNEQKQVQLNSWRDLGRIAPPLGYFYLDHKHQPIGENRKITLSKNWIMITEQNSQTLVSIEEYAKILDKFQKMEKIDLFRNWLMIKTFRKWKIMTEYHQLNLKRNIIQSKIQEVYKEVYLQLFTLLDRVRIMKFIGNSQNRSVTLEQYHNYLYNCSSDLLEEIHMKIFVVSVKIIFKPIKDLIINLKQQQQEAYNKDEIDNFYEKIVELQTKSSSNQMKSKYQKRIKRVIIAHPQKKFQLLKSIKFRESFIKFYPMLKKCILIFNESYIQWVKGCLSQVINKIEGSLNAWQQQKQKLNQILNTIVSNSSDKYTYYTPDFSEKQIGLISYSCQINQYNTIDFVADQDYLVSLFTQYTDFLINNLSLEKMVFCYQQYCRERCQTEIQLIGEIIKSNDTYTSQQIFQSTTILHDFSVRLNNSISVIFSEVLDVIDFYNILINSFLNAKTEYKNPSEIYQFLQSFKIKLLYLPKNIEVGLFSLDFNNVHQYLNFQIVSLQTELYINVPTQLKSLFNLVYQKMDESYKGIHNSMWTIDELLTSYRHFESYEDYRINQLHDDLDRFKNYLQVISVKCPQNYHESLIMFVHFKEIRDKLEIKAQIFTQRLPIRLKAFRNDIENLKEDIWKKLYSEQTSLIKLCKQSKTIDEKLIGLRLCELNLTKIKQNMDKLQIIGRLQIQYFIDQQLTINNHSYLKMKNQIKHLITFTEKFINFEGTIHFLFPKNIGQSKAQELLDKLKINVSEIKQIYLLLIAYETLLRQIIERYEVWRQYLETIDEIVYLSHDELLGIRGLKQLNINSKSCLTFQECFRINIHEVYEEIHQIKEKKVKVAELNMIFSDLDALQHQHPFHIKKNSKEKSKGKITSSGRILEQKKIDHSKYQFQNYGAIYRSLQQFQNQLRGLLNSIYLIQYKFEAALKIQRLQKAIKIMQQIYQARKQYNQIMSVQLFDDEGHERVQQRKKNLSQEIITFFQNYRLQRQEVREFWIKLINGISKRTLSQLLNNTEEAQNYSKSLSIKMKNLKDCVDVLVKKKRQEIYMLNLVDNSTVLAVIQYPNYYFELFYAVRELRKNGNDAQLVTIYDQMLILKKSENQKQSPIEINYLELKISNQLRRLLASYQNQHPIDNLLNYMTLQLPLQIVYVLDQLYFSENFLTNDKSSGQILKHLQGQIRLICRNGLRQQLDSGHVNYTLALFDQILSSRIELRTRIQNNPHSQIWYRNVLVFELYENMLTLRNFNTQILSSFRLVDPAALGLSFPFCQRALVKVCNTMKFQQSIVVQQTQIVATIAARTMSLFYKVKLSPNNIQNVLFACQQLYPLFVVGFVNNLEKDLSFVFEELNRVQRINSMKTNITKERRLLPSIFIRCQSSENLQLNQTLKLRFRNVNAVSPCPQVLLATKMLNNDFLIEKGLFLDLVFLLRTYIILLRQKKRYYISFHELSLICQKILRQLSSQSDPSSQSLIIMMFQDYFQSIDYPIDTLIKNFVVGKNRAQFQKSSIYQLSSSIIQNSVKHLHIAQDAALLIRMRQYEDLKRIFSKYSDQLLHQKFDSSFLQKLNQLFQYSFNLQNRPIAVIGPYQSGKNLLLKLFKQFLFSSLGKGQVRWRICNLKIFNSVLGGTISQNDPIIEQFILDNQEKNISWIIFEDFSFEQNFSLFDYIFSKIGQDVRVKGLPLGDLALSFCQLYHCRQKYLQSMHCLHNKYIGFKLQTLQNVPPSYICSLSKIYLSNSTLSLVGIYQLKMGQFLKQMIQKNQEFYLHASEDLFDLSKFLFNILDEILIKKLKSFQWLINLTHKIALERILQYFFSFFYHHGRQKLESIFKNDDHSVQLLKLMTYSTHVTIQNCVDRNSESFLQKIIKGAYYAHSKQLNKDRFLGKICIFTTKQINYINFEELQAEEQEDTQQNQFLKNNIIETQQIKLTYKKYLRQLVETQTTIIVTGTKQSGKSAMIKLFIDKYYSGMMIFNARNDEQALRELGSKLIGTGQASQSIAVVKTKMRKLDYCIYIEDISMNQSLSKAESYLRYIMQNGLLIEGNQLKAAPYITTIMQRRQMNQELQSRLWNCYLVNFYTDKEYFESIFSSIVSNRLQKNFKLKGKKNLNMAVFEKLSEKYLKIIRYCGQNFRRGHKTWTYQFQIVTLKSILINFIDRYNFQDLLSEQELSSRMSMQLIGRLTSRIQQSRDIEKIEDRISCLFESDQLKLMKERSQRENVLLNTNLDQDNLNKARIKNVVLSDTVKKFVPKVAIALRCSNCVLINKASVSFNRTITSVSLQILRVPIRQLFYCSNEAKFLSQIQRTNETNLKKNTVFYYYLSLQQIMGNPDVIGYIKNYLSKINVYPDSKDFYSYQCKFILQYSKSDYRSIHNYLSTGLLTYAYIMNYNEKGNEDLNQIAQKLLQQKLTGNGGGISRQMQNAVKTILRIFQDLKAFQAQKQVSNILFSTLNFSYLVLYLINSYGVLLKKVQTKQNALQLSLSQLNYMFKQYKERKNVYKVYQNEESILTAAINESKQQHRKLSLEYNSIKNQNLKEAILHNQAQISRLIRQRQHLMSSQKMWNNVYRNAHSAISRTQFAELKYMFMANYSIERQLFEVIAFVLGDQTDISSLKKCFSDINIMARIKETRIPDLHPDRLLELQSRLQSMSKRQRLNCGRNILEWLKIGCKLGLFRLRRQQSLSSLLNRIHQLQQQNKQIRQKNRMDIMEKQIQFLQKRLTDKSVQRNLIHSKINSIGSQLEQVKKQFEELIQFQTFCLQQLDLLQEKSKKLLSFCIGQALQFTLVQSLSGQQRRKFKDLIVNKMRKWFGPILAKQDIDYFDLLRSSSELKEKDNWLLRPKEYLSTGKKKLITQINSFLLSNNLIMVVIDKRHVLVQDTIKQNAHIMKFDNANNPSKKFQRNFEKYSLIIIQMSQWTFSWHLSENDAQNHGKYKIIKRQNIRVAFPANIPIIIVLNQYGSEEMMMNYKIIDLEYTLQDYYQVVMNTVIKRKQEKKVDLFSKLIKVQRKFMQIVYFLCKKTQSINLKSKQLIRTLTTMIITFNHQKVQSHHSGFQTLKQQQQEGDVRLCRVISKIIELMITYFPSQEHTSFFFRDLLNTSFEYIEMQGVRDPQNIINLIIELLTEGFKDKFPFLYLYYTRIHAVQEAIATPIQSFNLTALPDPRQVVSDTLKDADRDASNFFKYLPFKNIELQKIYGRLSKAQVRNQSQISRIIDSQKGLTLFNKLILKRALAPRSFEIYIGKMIREFQDKISLKNKMFLRRYVVKQKLFCVCDAGFWISKLKFTDQFRLVQLSQIYKSEVNVGRIQTWAVFDDMEEGEEKVQMLTHLVKVGSERVSIVLFSKEFLREDFRQEFKFLPFQHLLNIFEIKQLTKVSRSKYSHIFNKVIYFKTQLLRRKPFNQRISFSFLFQKIRQQIMNKEDYCIDQIVLHFEWDFFLWDSAYESNNMTLQYILSALDSNPQLINQFVADDQLQDRINSVIAKSRHTFIDESDICKLANQLRDSASRLDVRGTQKRDSDIFYLEFQFKKKKLVSQMEVIKKIAEIHIGKVDLTSQLALTLQQLLTSFSYSIFSDTLIKLINWRRMQGSKNALSIGLIENQLNFYLQFENFIYIYYQFPLENENETKQHENEQFFSIEKDNRQREDAKQQGKSQIIRRNSVKKETRQFQLQIVRQDSRKSTKMSSSVGNTKKNMKQTYEPSSSIDNIPRTQEQSLQDYFKNCIFMIQNRVLGLRKLTAKESKSIPSSCYRTLQISNKFGIRIVNLINVLNYKQQSRFKGSYQKS